MVGATFQSTSTAILDACHDLCHTLCLETLQWLVYQYTFYTIFLFLFLSIVQLMACWSRPCEFDNEIILYKK